MPSNIMNRRQTGLFLFVLVFVLLFAAAPAPRLSAGAPDNGEEIMDKAKNLSSRVAAVKRLIFSRRDVEAEKLFTDTLSFCRLHFDRKTGADIYFAVGNFFFDREDSPKKAVDYFLQALKMYEEENLTDQAAFSANMIGALYWHTDQYADAMKYYIKALKMFRETGGHELDIATILNNIGMVYSRLSNYDLALKCYLEALETRKKIGDPEPIAASLNNLGKLYLRMKDYPKALDYFNRSQVIRKKINDLDGVVRNLIDMGEIYFETGRPEEGVTRLREALKISKSINYRRGCASASIVLGQYYCKTKRYDTALPYLEKGIALAREIKSKELLNDACRCLAKIYAAKGDYRNAYRYSAQLKEKILTKEARQQLEDMRLAQAMEKKEQDMDRLKKENRIHRLENRVQVITFAGILLVVIIGATYIYKSNRFYKNELVRKEEKQRRLELETQLKLFQARINPHFLFNSLNSIKELGKTNDAAALEQTVQHLADMYRRILYSNNTIQVRLEKEIALVKDYLEIEKKMLKNRLDYIIDIEEGLGDFRVLPLTLETLVENAVIHGITPKQKGTVTITARKEEKMVLIEIMDDGAGFEIQCMEPGFGIYSVQERLKLFYNKKANFHIYSTPGKGTRVQLELPDG